MQFNVILFRNLIFFKQKYFILQKYSNLTKNLLEKKQNLKKFFVSKFLSFIKIMWYKISYKYSTFYISILKFILKSSR